MAATFQWSESNGAGEEITDGISNLNFGSNDSANLNTLTYPVIIGTNSYEKYIRIKFSGSGWSEISNVKLWKSAGAYKTGEVIKAISNQTYDEPVDTTSSKATEDIPTEEGSALDIESTEGDPSIFTEAGYSKYIVMQTQSTGSTPSGSGNTKTITVQYDEV